MDMAHGMTTSGPGGGGRPRELFISAVQYDEQLRSGAKTVLDLAPLAASFGVQGVEFRDMYWREKDSELPQVRRQLAQHKLKAAYATRTPLYHPDPAMQRKLIEDIEDARGLGAMLLRVNVGQRPGAGPADARTHYAGRMGVERAAALRVHLTLENNSRPPDHLLSDMRETLGSFSCRFLGTTIDFANYVTTGQDPLEAIPALARWINYVHVKDARKIAEGWQSTYLGDGNLPLKAIMAALDATGKPIPLCFEFPGDGDPDGRIRKSLEYLATLEG
jgi:sugar phosphate isomerase/epimerase